MADMVNQWIESCKEIGILYNPDINAPASTIGVSNVISHIKPDGELHHGLPPHHGPLPPEPRPVGVEIAQSATGERFRVAAGKEVALSAGPVGTPQILTASGVGPKEGLEKAGVEVVKDVPHIGKNMFDHVVAPLGCVIFRATESLDYVGAPTGSLFPLVAEACAFFWSELFVPNSPAAEDTTSSKDAPVGEKAFAIVGTTRMGTSIEDGAVDSSLRVHGIGRPRVVDASSFPTQPSGHLRTAIMATADKAADLMGPAA
ncbi:hypothetical protein FRC06_003541 [Ceratobasidium sp. 370]|nr:hypothetical protein FRC06_003541 [Ceratobasidium sp. 370]